MACRVECHVLLYPGLISPVLEADTEIACIGKAAENKVFGRTVLAFRQPLYGLGRKGDINGVGGFCHHHRHEPLPA